MSTGGGEVAGIARAVWDAAPAGPTVAQFAEAIRDALDLPPADKFPARFRVRANGKEFRVVVQRDGTGSVEEVAP